MKRCTHCHQTKPVDQFFTAKRRDGRLVPQSWCKECKRIDQARRYAEHRKPTDERKTKTWRPPFGEKSHKAKLSDHEVQLALQLKGMPSTTVAEKLGVHYNTIRRIWRGETWTHVRIE